jgi:biopolymer transport protein ExbD
MGISVGPSGSGDEDEVVSTINTTPLVDIMLVLLIIFLITVPVVTKDVPVQLPDEANQPTQTRPENIVIAVTKDGEWFWNEEPVADFTELVQRLKRIAPQVPQPEVHIRGDDSVRYQYVGRVMLACQLAGIAKVAFITEPQPHG